MNWKIKAHTLAVLSRVPGGRRAYHALQKGLGTNRLNLSESLGRSAELFGMIRDAGTDIDGKVCLEIGTGWRPLVPFFLSLAGAQRVITFDVNPWLDLAYVRQTYEAVRDHLDEIADRLHLKVNAVRERFLDAPCDLRDRASILQSLRVDYRCPADAGATGLPDNSVDIIVSTNVLEHVQPDDLRRIHRESHRVLATDGVAAHRVDVADHFTAVDRDITQGNFLRYSERAWNWYGGSGLSYHNRLRCVDQVRLLQEAGFSTVRHRARVSEPTLQALRAGSLPVNAAFAEYSDDELAGSFVWMTGIKG